jgi:hypothetical protein
MSAAKDIADYFINQTQATAIGTDIFVNFLPPDIDNCIVIYDTGGPPSDKAFGDKEVAFKYPRIQVRVRNTNIVTAESKAGTLHGLLDGWNGATLNSVVYLDAECIESQPFFLIMDDLNRTNFVFNVELQRR